MAVKQENPKFIHTDILLLISALIWGFAFVAQRKGMEYVQPFTFNGIRFILGGLFLLPFAASKKADLTKRNTNLFPALIAGFILFTAASLQQMGIVYTSAGNAGFITGLYVVFVPIIGIFIGRKTGWGTWLGVLLAAAGMYLLTATTDIAVSKGNFLVLLSAVFWAFHVLSIDRFTKRADPIFLAMRQFLLCGILSLIIALIKEEIIFASVFKAAIPIIYGGLISVGVGFTLQIVAQKRAHPAHAAVILSLEAVFAFLGGVFILHEILTVKRISGCLLMLAGMIVSQIWQRNRIKE